MTNENAPLFVLADIVRFEDQYDRAGSEEDAK